MKQMNSIEKALYIFKYIQKNQNMGVRLTDLHHQTQWPKSTISRLLKPLVNYGLVLRNEKNKRYYLGRWSSELAQHFSEQSTLINQYQPLIEVIATRTGDATFLVVLKDLDTLCIARAIGTFPIQALTIKIGNRQPIGIGAGGLAMLASFSDAELHYYLEKNADRLYKYNRMTTDKLLHLVDKTKEKGYSVIGSYAVKGVTGVGVTLNDKEGRLVGGISTATLSHRMTESYQNSIASAIQKEIVSFYS